MFSAQMDIIQFTSASSTIAPRHCFIITAKVLISKGKDFVPQISACIFNAS